MPFEWSVQPYQFKKNLVEHYTQAMMVAGRKKAVEHAAEAEKWMKDNAPWTDRTLEERMQEYTRAERRRHVEGEQDQKVKLRQRSEAPFLLGARAGLQVEVNDEDKDALEREIGSIEREMKQAEKALNQANAERKRMRREADRFLSEKRREAFRLGKAEQFRERFEAQAARNAQKYAMQTFDASPYIQRQVEAVKGFKSLLPIATLKFQHNERVHYAVWLEIAMGQRYAIISKAVERYSGKFFNELSRLTRLKQYRDQVAFGATMTPQQTFEQHVASTQAAWAEQGKNRVYEPWNEDRRMRRQSRRKEYTYENYRLWAETGVGKRERARLKELAEQQERSRQAAANQRGATSSVRTYNPFSPSTSRSRR